MIFGLRDDFLHESSGNREAKMAKGKGIIFAGGFLNHWAFGPLFRSFSHCFPGLVQPWMALRLRAITAQKC
jgi:hypothetical protein